MTERFRNAHGELDEEQGADGRPGNSIRTLQDKSKKQMLALGLSATALLGAIQIPVVKAALSAPFQAVMEFQERKGVAEEIRQIKNFREHPLNGQWSVQTLPYDEESMLLEVKLQLEGTGTGKLFLLLKDGTVARLEFPYGTQTTLKHIYSNANPVAEVLLVDPRGNKTLF